jgi:hypothetical protein
VLNQEAKISYVVERAKGIEPSYAAWEAAVLPLNYAREIMHLADFLMYRWQIFGRKPFESAYAGGNLEHTRAHFSISALNFAHDPQILRVKDASSLRG